MDEAQKKKAEHDSEEVGEHVAKGLGAAADVLAHGISGAASGIVAGIDAVHDTPEQPDR